MALHKIFIRNLKKWRKAAGLSHSFIEKLANVLNIEPYLLFFDEKMDKSDFLEKMQATEANLIEIISDDIRKVFEKL